MTRHLAQPSIKTTRAQRRELKKLAVLVDRACESDRMFFERFPQRRHRVRRSHSAEARQEEILRGEPLRPHPRFAWFSVVRNVAPGVRLRLLLLNHNDAEVDLSEEMCREIFETAATPPVQAIEEELRATFGGEAS